MSRGHDLDLKIKIRRLFSALLTSSGIHSLLERICLSEQAFVLVYHRILPSAENQACYVQPGMFVTPETFEQQVAYVRNHFNVVFLNDLVEKAQKGEPIGRHCALTFDDGWRDNYTDAFPVLEKYRVPATIFLATGFVGTTKTFWPEELCFYLEQIDLGTFAGINAPPSWGRFTSMIDRFQCSGRERFLDRSIETMKALTISDREEILNYLRKMLEAQAIPRQMMNWDEVRTMGLSGLVRFGAHTVNHEILDQVPLRRAQVEITDSRDEIELQLKNKITTFAYPNGNYTAGVRNLLVENGFDVAVTTRKGLLGRALPSLEIPRISLHEDISATIPMLRSKILLHAF
jgi:peptidoglycan/xylan/chitin deacetylase (PgdA/CDA1 family)